MSFELRQRALAPVVRVLAEAGIEAILYKGAAYSATLYPDPELRPMGDVDLLVRPRDFEAAGAALASAGLARYVSHTDTDPLQHERAYIGAGMNIDLHRWVVQPPRHRVDTEEVWAGATLLPAPVPPGGSAASLYQLDPLHRLLLHCLNQAVHEYTMRAVAWTDLQGMLAASPPDAAAVAATARRWRIARPVALSLQLLERLLPGSVPAPLLAVSPLPPALAATAGAYLSAWSAAPAEESAPWRPSRAASVRLKLRLLDGVRERSGFLWYTLRARLARLRAAGVSRA